MSRGDPDGGDLSARVSRDDLDAAIDAIARRAAAPLERLLARRAADADAERPATRAKTKAKTNAKRDTATRAGTGRKPPADAIEIVGGAARTPAVRAALAKIAASHGVPSAGASGDALGRHLDMDEAVALARNAPRRRDRSGSASDVSDAPILLDAYPRAIRVVARDISGAVRFEPFDVFEAGSRSRDRASNFEIFRVVGESRRDGRGDLASLHARIPFAGYRVEGARDAARKGKAAADRKKNPSKKDKAEKPALRLRSRRTRRRRTRARPIDHRANIAAIAQAPDDREDDEDDSKSKSKSSASPRPASCVQDPRRSRRGDFPRPLADASPRRAKRRRACARWTRRRANSRATCSPSGTDSTAWTRKPRKPRTARATNVSRSHRGRARSRFEATLDELAAWLDPSNDGMDEDENGGGARPTARPTRAGGWIRGRRRGVLPTIRARKTNRRERDDGDDAEDADGYETERERALARRVATLEADLDACRAANRPERRDEL